MTEKDTDKNGKTKETSKTEFRHDTKEVNGIRLHYVTAGEGEPLVLIHGSPQTWYCWHGIMPQFAEYYTVIAVDLRGAGNSSKSTATSGDIASKHSIEIKHPCGHFITNEAVRM